MSFYLYMTCMVNTDISLWVPVALAPSSPPKCIATSEMSRKKSGSKTLSRDVDYNATQVFSIPQSLESKEQVSVASWDLWDPILSQRRLLQWPRPQSPNLRNSNPRFEKNEFSACCRLGSKSQTRSKCLSFEAMHKTRWFDKDDLTLIKSSNPASKCVDLHLGKLWPGVSPLWQPRWLSPCVSWPL